MILHQGVDVPWEVEHNLHSLLLRLLDKCPATRISLSELRETEWVTRNGEYAVPAVHLSIAEKSALEVCTALNNIEELVERVKQKRNWDASDELSLPQSHMSPGAGSVSLESASELDFGRCCSSGEVSPKHRNTGGALLRSTIFDKYHSGARSVRALSINHSRRNSRQVSRAASMTTSLNNSKSPSPRRLQGSSSPSPETMPVRQMAKIMISV